MKLETDRLIIRDFVKEDAKAFYQIAKNENVGPKCNWWPHPDVKYTKTIIKLYRKNGTTFAICLKNGELIGSIQAIKYFLRDETYEIGYCIDPKHWNKGYATEACKAIINYYFKYVNCNTILALTMLDNLASEKVLNKLGFELEGILKNCRKDIKARYIDCKSFSLNRHDFERNEIR